MRHFLKPSRWIVVLMLAMALAQSTASAQEADTLIISGTFQSYGGRSSINGVEYPGMIGDDLAEVYASSNENMWTLTLHGISYSHDYYYVDWYEEWGYGYDEQYITSVVATSSDFEFFGPDADVLNMAVSPQLVSGNASFVLRNGFQDGALFSDDNGPYALWELYFERPAAGVSFNAVGSEWATQFPTDEQGYPVEPQQVGAYYSIISDHRPGNSGGLVSYDDLVEIGSDGPPTPTLRISDLTVAEENTGAAAVAYLDSASLLI